MSKEKEKKKRTSLNSVAIVGTLAEVGNLKVFEEDGDKVIKAEDFKKPAFVVEVNGQKVGIKTFPTSESKKPDKFKALKTIMGYEVGTRVKVSGCISVGDPYLSKKGNVVESVDVTMYSLSTTNVPDEDFAEGEVSGYVKGTTPELDKDGEETGRLIIDFWIYNEYNDDKSLKPFQLVADGKKMVSACEDEFGEGGSAVIDFNIIVSHVGAEVKQSDGGFGSRSKRIVNGFSKVEYTPFYGKVFDDDDEEFSDLYLDEDDVKTMLKAHKQKCEEAKNAEKNEKPSKKGLGSRKKPAVDDDYDDVDDDPFE